MALFKIVFGWTSWKLPSQCYGFVKFNCNWHFACAWNNSMAQLILAQVPFGFVKCYFSCCVRLKRCLLSTVLWRDSACCRTNSRSFSIDNFQCPIDNFQFAISVCCRNPPRGKWFGPLCSSGNFHSFLAIFRFKHAVCKKTCCSHGSIWLSLKNYFCFFGFKSPKKNPNE